MSDLGILSNTMETFGHLPAFMRFPRSKMNRNREFSRSHAIDVRIRPTTSNSSPSFLLTGAIQIC